MELLTDKQDTLTLADTIQDKIATLQTMLSQSDEYDAFRELDNVIIYTHQVEEISSALKCVALAIMKQRWDDGLVPLTESASYEHSFYNYAFNRTGCTGSTVRNWIDAGRTWLEGLPEGIPKSVELYDRDGNPTGECVEPNPFLLNRSKLVLTKAAAKDGRLTDDPVALGQLFNRDVGIHTVLDTLNNGKDKSNIAHAGLKLWFEGSYLLAQDGFSEPEVVAEFYVGDNDIVNQAIRYITSALNIGGR